MSPKSEKPRTQFGQRANITYMVALGVQKRLFISRISDTSGRERGELVFRNIRTVMYGRADYSAKLFVGLRVIMNFY